MAKGKTNQPLVIWVAPQWLDHKKIMALVEQGHLVLCTDTDIHDREPDLILHPAAHRWDDELWDYLDIAIKAARARRRKK